MGDMNLNFNLKTRIILGFLTILVTVCSNIVYGAEVMVEAEPTVLAANTLQPQLLSKVKKSGKYGYITQAGTFLIPAEFDELKLSNQDIISAKQKKKYGFFDQNGKNIIPVIFDEVRTVQDDQIAV